MTFIEEENSNLPEQTVGIVCALHLEVAPLLDKLNPSRTQTGNGLKYYECHWGNLRVVIVEGGVGYNRAKVATHALIDAIQPEWILSVGLSGSLVADVKLSDIVLANSLIRQNGMQEVCQRFEYPGNPERGLHVGKLCTADHIVHTCNEKQELHERTRAIAVDMESHSVAMVCKERDIQFMAIRAISDDLSADLPKEVLAIFGPKGTIRTGALVGTIFKRPSSVKDLWKIRENAVRAAENLARTTLDLLPQLVPLAEE
ncbi:MAG: 5'-methylthioadenosine nucleosidase [Planctomicrobium sp.]|jgi:adenosylhomocysteine nucleosidase|nr:5'-methylthioadenosine nucleosidase [Planctomicrobium sp.]